MSTFTFSKTLTIHVAGNRVYDILADFAGAHQDVIPKKYFGPATIVAGGVGEGTVLTFQMHVMGRTVDCRSVVTEPEPGRVLVETEQNSGTVTSFTVECTGYAKCDVTIASKIKKREGFGGWLDQQFVTLMFGHIYAQELKLLSAKARAAA